MDDNIFVQLVAYLIFIDWVFMKLEIDEDVSIVLTIFIGVFLLFSIIYTFT